jgi:outer membrane protein TolC
MIKVKLVGYKKRISTFIVVVLLSACSHNPTSESSAKDDFAVELKELPWQSAERSASEASLESKVYDWHATRLTLTAAVAGTWFEWLMLDEQLDNARWYLRAAEKQFNFIQAAYNSGGATHIELAQQRKQVLSRSSNIKKLTHQKNQARNALAILLGEVPQNFNPPKIKLMSLQVPRPDPGLPAEILIRRPDLAREEALLKVANANVKEVRAAIYPSFSLQASARLASDSLSLADPTRTFSLGADIIQSIFDFGERSRRIELTEAKQKEMLLSYYQTVLVALAEVEDALSNEQLIRDLEIQQRQLIKENNLIATKTEYLYNAGAETLSNLLDVQLGELQAKDILFELYQQRLTASLSLYKALGGGWAHEP